jgi:hypothetical protein
MDNFMVQLSYEIIMDGGRQMVTCPGNGNMLTTMEEIVEELNMLRDELYDVREELANMEAN